jgi:Family of unknown function (DUF5752)
MATAPLPLSRQHWARAPFYFNSAAHLMRIVGERADNLEGLLDGLRSCPDEAIFQHTFQTLEEHHFIREGFSNDFAHWAFSACNEVALAEKLAAVDVREFTSTHALRARLIEIVKEYLATHPRAGERPALEPFHFCASDTVVIPTPLVARNLDEFAEGLKQASIYCVHYHFIEARLRLKLNSNDFSMWLEKDMELHALADRVNRIDIYTSTLNDIRRKIIRIVEGATA